MTTATQAAFVVINARKVDNTRLRARFNNNTFDYVIARLTSDFPRPRETWFARLYARVCVDRDRQISMGETFRLHSGKSFSEDITNYLIRFDPDSVLDTFPSQDF